MSLLKRNQFQLTFIAMAILSLSACSTTSNPGGFDFGDIGDGISKVGSKTAELGSNAWQGTKNILNIGPQESEPLDEVDLALMDDDVVLEEVQINTTELKPVLEQTAIKPTLGAANENKKLAFGEVPKKTTAAEEIAALGKIDNKEQVLAATNDQPIAISEQPAATSEQVPVASAGNGNGKQLIDLVHEVAQDQTLWDIAKITTGDATNWHILADINNLAPNASVFPGQKLTIPADMVSPEYSGPEQPPISKVAEVKLVEPATSTTTTTVAGATVEKPALPSSENAAVALKIPAAKVDAQTKPESVVAAAEQDAASATLGDPAKISDDALAIKVGAGETLWDFAKRTTGDATNWKQIAEKNMFDDKQLARIRPGQKIFVPADIIRARDENGTLIAKGQEGTVPNANVGGIAPENELAVAASAAVLTGTNKPAAAEPAEEDIKIVEAAFQYDKPVKVVTPEALAAEASEAVAANDQKLGKVMIKGTYYPKAVYNNADFSSSLLMRVSPGTQLLVSKAIGPWLEVTTAKGIGYVHSRDIK